MGRAHEHAGAAPDSLRAGLDHVRGGGDDGTGAGGRAHGAREPGRGRAGRRRALQRRRFRVLADRRLPPLARRAARPELARPAHRRRDAGAPHGAVGLRRRRGHRPGRGARVRGRTRLGRDRRAAAGGVVRRQPHGRVGLRRALLAGHARPPAGGAARAARCRLRPAGDRGRVARARRAAGAVGARPRARDGRRLVAARPRRPARDRDRILRGAGDGHRGGLGGRQRARGRARRRALVRVRDAGRRYAGRARRAAGLRKAREPCGIRRRWVTQRLPAFTDPPPRRQPDASTVRSR